MIEKILENHLFFKLVIGVNKHELLNEQEQRSPNQKMF